MPSQDENNQIQQLVERLGKLEDEVSHLRKENQNLKDEVTHLRKENKELRQENSKLREENKSLKTKVNKLEARIRQLEGPNTPSSQIPNYLKSNSKKDESSSAETDGENSSVKQPSNAKKAKRGRKKGHKGSTKVRPPDRTENDLVDNCHNCGNSVRNQDQTSIYGYQKFEVKILSEMVRYIAHRVKCPNCQYISESGPQNKGTIFGPGTLSLLGSLWYDLRAPLNRLSLLFEGIVGEEFSDAVFYNGLAAIDEKLEPITDGFKQEVLDADYVGIDETGYPVSIEGREMNWIWVFNTNDHVFYEFRESRGKVELEEIWDRPPEDVIPMVDGWHSYSYFPVIGRCWSHILRLAKELAKRCLIGKEMSDQLHQLFHDIKRFRELRPELASKIIRNRALERINSILEQGRGNDICETLRKFIVTLDNAKESLLTAIEHPELWLTNNLSERNLRKFVIHRKIRGYVASERGKQILTNFATVFETLRLQNKNPHQELQKILAAS